jgi:hypothetical protein
MEAGPMVARIIYDSGHDGKHRAIEMRNSGMTLALKTEYRHPTAAITRFLPAASSVLSMHWTSSIVFNLEPVLVRVRSKHDFIGMDDPHLLISDPDFLEDPPVLSIGNVDIALVANAIAQIDGVAEAIAVIDRASLAADLSVIFETICLELWHPIAVDATLRLISTVPNKPPQIDRPEDVTRPRFLNFPIGISSKVAVDRLVCLRNCPRHQPKRQYRFIARIFNSLYLCPRVLCFKDKPCSLVRLPTPDTKSSRTTVSPRSLVRVDHQSETSCFI